jgi:hypothetical protein
MTFLELVQRTRRECGISGDGPVTTVDQVREMKRLVDWVSQAWVDIQNARSDWEFMWESFTFPTVAGQREYTAAGLGLTSFKKWRHDSFRLYLQSAGAATETFLDYFQSFANFRNYYLVGSQQLVRARPLDITVTPERKLWLGPVPNDIYIVSGEYYRKAQVLADDADVPDIDEDYHMLIVYGAMKKYGMFEVANEQITAAREESATLANRMLLEYTPNIELGGGFI